MELPSPLGMHHVALFVDDLKRSEAFYCGLLGYAVEWRPDEENLYLTMNGQDNLALHKKKDSRGNMAKEDSRLDHFGILLRRPADVDLWHIHLRAKGAFIAQEPKTHRDGARSFYVKDPDGIMLQFLYHPPISDRPT